MKKLILLLLFSISLSFGISLEDGIKAYENKEYDKAFDIFMTNQENSEAEFYLGLMYNRGESVKRDYEKAVELYTLASNKGHAEAQNNLGFLYANGYGVKADYTKAFELYTLSAKQGYSKAQINLGLLYSIKRDYKKTIELYTLASNQGDPDAQNMLGLIYFKGEGTPENKLLAYKLWVDSAKGGNYIAQRNLDMLCNDSPWACK